MVSNKLKQQWYNFISIAQEVVQLMVPNIDFNELFGEGSMSEIIYRRFSKYDLAAWLVFDTKENRENTYIVIDHILEDLNLFSLATPSFIEPLINSMNSIYRINHIKNEYILIENMIQIEPAKMLYVPDSTRFEEGDIFYGRIIESDKSVFLFQICDLIPKEFNAIFLDKFYELFYHHTGKEVADLSREMLKQYTPEIMFIYSQTLDELTSEHIELKNTQDIDIVTEEDLDLLSFFSLYNKGNEDDKELSLLMQFVFFIEEEILQPAGKSFSEIEAIDLDHLIFKLTEEGLFISDQRLLDFINFLEAWIDYKSQLEKLDSIIKVKNNIFKYKISLQNSISGFYIDKHLLRIVEKYDLNKENIFLNMFNDFVILSRNDESLAETESGKLNLKSLRLLSKEFNLQPIKQVDRYEPRHFPILQLMHAFAKSKGFLEVDNNHELVMTNYFGNYTLLSDSKQLALWIEALFSEPFMSQIKGFKEDKDTLSQIKVLFTELSKEETLDIHSLISRMDIGKRDIEYFKILSMLGLLDHNNIDHRLYFKLTDFGKDIAKHYGLFYINDSKDSEILEFRKEFD